MANNEKKPVSGSSAVKKNIEDIAKSTASGMQSLAKKTAKPQMLFGVSAGSFMPAPKVDSAVIRLDILKEPPVQADEGLFFAVVRAAFSQRRKVISNSLSAGLGKSKEEILAVLEAANVLPTARAEKLSLEDFAAIANAIGE